jgi:hypothetical protein
MLPSVEGFAQWILSMARAEPSRRAKDKAELVEQIMEVFEAAVQEPWPGRKKAHRFKMFNRIF